MIQQLATDLILAAYRQRVSDVYLLPTATGYQLRFRRGARPLLWRDLSLDQGQRLLTYFKFHADMTVSERRRPQVGALTWPVTETHVELRLSTVGDYVGRESLVIRLIYPYQASELAYLLPRQRAQVAALAQQRGLVLFAGPTGAGKTTTMYTIARELAQRAVVLTIEDPVEVKEPQFIQLQVNAMAQMTYDTLIQVGLRHRPDVFVIGEIRDARTAQAAVRAALSGHLVLSTVHAKSATGTRARLTDLGIADAQLRQVLVASSYQRLIPRTARGPAVLLDLVTDAALWQPGTWKGWRQALDEAFHAGTITQTTQRAFQNG